MCLGAFYNYECCCHSLPILTLPTHLSLYMKWGKVKLIPPPPSSTPIHCKGKKVIIFGYLTPLPLISSYSHPCYIQKPPLGVILGRIPFKGNTVPYPCCFFLIPIAPLYFYYSLPLSPNKIVSLQNKICTLPRMLAIKIDYTQIAVLFYPNFV